MNYNPAPPVGFFTPRKIVVESWQKWFAWYPTVIHNKRVWLRYIYRRRVVTYVDMDKWFKYEYGDLFDILR